MITMAIGNSRNDRVQEVIAFIFIVTGIFVIVMGAAIFYLERVKRKRQQDDIWLENHKNEIMEEVLN